MPGVDFAKGQTTAKGDLEVHNGTTFTRLAVGSNTHVLTADSTQTLGMKWAPNQSVPTEGGDFHNLGMSYAAGSGTFTIHGYDGTSLSASNPATVWLQSKAAPGLLVMHTIEANQDFIDDNGASEIIGALFGFTTSVAITADVPFFVYAVTNDDEDNIAFMISREPHRFLSPPAAYIGDPSAPTNASAQRSMFSLEDITEAEYDENPCMALGGFRMVMSASDDWTVQTLDNGDGFGMYHLVRDFEVPLGQFGTNSGTWSFPNGGTAAVFTNYTDNRYRFVARRCPQYIQKWGMDGDGGTDGSGAVRALISTPFTPYTSALAGAGAGSCRIENPADSEFYAAGKDSSGDNRMFFRKYSDASTTSDWADFSNGDRRIQGSALFRIDTEKL